jgi:hypothetical protein
MTRRETKPRFALLACGALAKETAAVAKRNHWDADIHGVSSFDHMDPPKIARDVDGKLASLAGEYERVVVVYGDCGTAGALDDVLAKYPNAVRPEGVHCYQWFVQETPEEIVDTRTRTYFFTDWLVRNWGRAVIKGLGLDRYPWLKDEYFGSLNEVLFLRQDAEDPRLQTKAEEIAAYLELPLVIKDTGLDPLEQLLTPLMEDADVFAG